MKNGAPQNADNFKPQPYNYTKPVSLANWATMKHTIIAINVGISVARAVHFALPVSFLMVHKVVPHG